MNAENENKGFFGRLFGGSSTKKNSCCNIELEEIPEESLNDQDKKAPKEKSGGSCCK